jgi:predicted SAM-dependent methyltransferase
MKIKRLVKRLLRFHAVGKTLKKGGVKLCIGLDRSLISKGWISVGMDGDPDILEDAAKLAKVPDSCCEIILASHILEHLHYSGWGNERARKTIEILKRWGNKLRTGGKCIVCVPDLDLIVKVLKDNSEHYWNLENTVYKDVMSPFFGNMDNTFNAHSMAYNFSCLRYCMEKAGFTGIEKVKDSRLLLSDYNPSNLHWVSVNVVGVWKGQT